MSRRQVMPAKLLRRNRRNRFFWPRQGPAGRAFGVGPFRGSQRRISTEVNHNERNIIGLASHVAFSRPFKRCVEDVIRELFGR